MNHNCMKRNDMNLNDVNHNVRLLLYSFMKNNALQL